MTYIEMITQILLTLDAGTTAEYLAIAKTSCETIILGIISNPEVKVEEIKGFVFEGSIVHDDLSEAKNKIPLTMLSNFERVIDIRNDYFDIMLKDKSYYVLHKQLVEQMKIQKVCFFRGVCFEFQPFTDDDSIKYSTSVVRYIGYSELAESDVIEEYFSYKLKQELIEQSTELIARRIGIMEQE
ncbi:MAG: hypothetical protein B6229_03080 [Spirochaetaceae bacterium 4572_7]|nr:MAG: hypothetical protein B6229_03080 [Spirochaetaceae bacterium 4572_7]